LAADTENKEEENSFGAMGGKSGGVVFQGNGDPLVAVGVVVETRNGVTGGPTKKWNYVSVDHVRTLCTKRH